MIVSDIDIAAAVYGYALWAIKLTVPASETSPLGDKLAAGCKFLNPIIKRVSDVDVAAAV